MTLENDNQSSKEEVIAQLRETIEQLEISVKQLNENSAISLPDSTAVKDLIQTTNELTKVIVQQSLLQKQNSTNITENNEVEKEETNFNQANSENLDLETNKTSLETIKTSIDPLETVSVTKNNQDEATTTTLVVKQPKKSQNKWLVGGAIAGILLLIIIPLSWKLFLADKMPQLIAQDKITITEPTIIQPDNSNTLVVPEPTDSENQPTLNNLPTAETISNQNTNISNTETQIINKFPSELVAENRPKKINLDTVKPNLKLTPEQNLIAALEKKTHSLAENYNENLVLSIQPNFAESIVLVTLADDWYQLVANRQDKIMSEILKQSRQLEFNKLKITDSANNLVARSPIVGNDMVILRRTT